MPHRDIGRSVAFVVHDVAPSTWAECATLLQLLDQLGAKPVTILVVPHYHYQNPIIKETRFIAALDERLARGDELVLHGFHHYDDEPPPRTLRGFVERRLLTRLEDRPAGEVPRGAAVARERKTKNPLARSGSGDVAGPRLKS